MLALVKRRRLLPFIDMAYQGLGDGLDADAFGMRLLCAELPEVLCAVSCSKNFGLYRERTGALHVHQRDRHGAADAAFSQLVRIARGIWSMPPDHGAAIVHGILDDAALREQWIEEVAAMRGRIEGLRREVVQQLREHCPQRDFGFIGGQRGMFSYFGISTAQVRALRERHHIYMTDDSRMNIAGLRRENLEYFARAVASARAGPDWLDACRTWRAPARERRCRRCARSCARPPCGRRHEACRGGAGRPAAVHAALAAGPSARAARWVEVARADKRSRPLVDSMLEQFPLDSAQGKALMSLAEALLRTPDPKRADQLIAERLATVRAAGVPGDTELLLRTGFTLLGAAGRLLPDVFGELSGEFSAASLTKPLIAPGGARGAAPVDAAARRRVHRRRDHRRGARARPLGSRSSRCAPSTCSARGRAPMRTRSATSMPMRTRSRRSPRRRRARPTRARGSR